MKFNIPNRDKFYIEICFLDESKIYSFADFERALGFNKPQIDLRKLLKFLAEQKLIEHKDTIQGVRYYKINKKRLRDFYDEQEVRVYHDKFSKEFHIFDY